MKRLAGFGFALLAAYLFVLAVFEVVPNDSPRAVGHNVGVHLVWICVAGIAYFLLRKGKDDGGHS